MPLAIRQESHWTGAVCTPYFKDLVAEGPNAPNEVIALKAVNFVIAHGPTTDATAFIANPHGALPTRAQIGRLGHVEPATPAVVDGVYFSMPNPD